MLQERRSTTGFETLFIGIAAGLIAIFAVIYFVYLITSPFTTAPRDQINVASSVSVVPVNPGISYSYFLDNIHYIEANGALPANSAYELNEHYRYLVTLLVNGTINASEFDAYLGTLDSVMLFESYRDIGYSEFMQTLDYIDVNGVFPANSAYELNEYYRYLVISLVNGTIDPAQFESYLGILDSVTG